MVRKYIEGQKRKYNAALQERPDAWKVCRKSINYYDQANQLKPMRAEGLLGLANFCCCQDVLRRLDETVQAFCARLRRGEKPGFPRFRSFQRYDSITFPSYGNGCRLLDDGKLRIQAAGLIKVKLHRPVEGEVKTVTIKRDVNHWYVFFRPAGHRRVAGVVRGDHHLSRGLVERYGLIAVEDLNIRGLSRGILAGPGPRRRMELFLLPSSGTRLPAPGESWWDPRGTSQVCVCGAAVPKTLAELWHECPACGLSA